MREASDVKPIASVFTHVGVRLHTLMHAAFTHTQTEKGRTIITSLYISEILHLLQNLTPYVGKNVTTVCLSSKILNVVKLLIF